MGTVVFFFSIQSNVPVSWGWRYRELCGGHYALMLPEALQISKCHFSLTWLLQYLHFKIVTYTRLWPRRREDDWLHIWPHWSHGHHPGPGRGRGGRQHPRGQGPGAVWKHQGEGQECHKEELPLNRGWRDSWQFCIEISEWCQDPINLFSQSLGLILDEKLRRRS